MPSDLKFNRNYELSIQSNSDSNKFIQIQNPFTIEFSIVKNTLASANTASYTVYNLSREVVSDIHKDQYEFDLLKNIKFRAGYGDSLTEISNTDAISIYTSKQKNNIVTKLECYDGGHASVNATTDLKFDKGTPKKKIVRDILETLRPSGISVGAIGSIEGSIKRGNSYSGNSADILDEITGGGFFMDNGKAYVMGDSEYRADRNPFVINSGSGLIGSPTKENTFVKLEILFEPNIVIGQEVIVESTTTEIYNAAYKVISLTHAGTISEGVSGEVTTTLGLSTWNVDFNDLNSGIK